ncbi:MAG: hypothetical protein F6K14_06120 [Symploca sp. SIO2C1]|nr:hypothetical protein [Symploca sp. SIO2C1]
MRIAELNKFTVAITANILTEETYEYPNFSEIKAEYYSLETIEKIVTSLEQTGSKVILIDSGDKAADLSTKIEKHQPEIDLVLNIAEGIYGSDSRHSLVPAILDRLGIPYTGSSAESHALVADKFKSREALTDSCVLNPRFQRLSDLSQLLENNFPFPVIVKPTLEGGSIGITQANLVYDRKELQALAADLIQRYHQPVIVEVFLSGKEHHVGIVGNLVLPVISVDLAKLKGIPLVRDQEAKGYDTPFFMPKQEFDDHYLSLVVQSISAFVRLGLKDYCRMDFRDNANRTPYFIEANSLAGLHPTKSNLPRAAECAGISYGDLINAIVHTAAQRHLQSGIFTKFEIAHITQRFDKMMSSVHAFSSSEEHGYKVLKPRKYSSTVTRHGFRKGDYDEKKL